MPNAANSKAFQEPPSCSEPTTLAEKALLHWLDSQGSERIELRRPIRVEIAHDRSVDTHFRSTGIRR